MKRISWIPAMISLSLLVGCVPSITNDTEVIQETDSEVEKTIIPSFQLSDQYYRTLLPYEQSDSRGMIVSNVNSKYDVKEVENGLTRISQRFYSPDKYFFQEGQTLDADVLNSWLSRKSEKEPLGLNPVKPEGKMDEQKAKQSPIYLAHILEQNYLVKTDDNKVKLDGISIGLALNSTYYYQKIQYGPTFEEIIPDNVLLEQGKKMANEIVARMRTMEGLENVPITVGLFKQESRNSIVPGTYMAFGNAAEGKGSIGEWTPINEEYILFPQPITEEKYREIDNAFKNFKQDIDKYFSNYTSVVATGFYQDDMIKKVTLDIPIQFYGSSEIIGFTQYMAGLVMTHFPDSIQVEVSVTSINGPEAFLMKKAGDKEPYVHVYD
ncbi:MAG: CamS family sex pheromone protein [Paenisporosarcina sp.]